MMSSFTLPVRLWSISHEPGLESRRIQHKGPAKRSNLVLSVMGPFRVAASRLRFPHVKTRRLEPSELSLLLQHRAHDNRRFRISGRCWTTLRGKCARGGTTLLPDSTHFSKWLPRITGDVWRSKHTVESSASVARRPLRLGESYGPRSALCTASLVSLRIRYHRYNGILILHRLQGCRHLS